MPHTDSPGRTLSSSTLTGSRSQDMISDGHRHSQSEERKNRIGTSSYGKYPDGPPDPRRNCVSQLNKLYTFEAYQGEKGRVQTGTTDNQGSSLMDAVTNKQATITTGRRKKNDCLQVAALERLVGMDVDATPGMRVVLSTNTSNLRPPGRPSCGTIQKVYDRGLECSVKWDNGDGPYRYATSRALGFHLVVVDPEREQEFAVAHKSGDVGVHIVHCQSDATSRANAAALAEELTRLGCSVTEMGGGADTAHMASLHGRLRNMNFCVILLDAPLAALLSNSAASVHKELEYVLQLLADTPSATAILHMPPAPPPSSALARHAMPLARALSLSVNSPAQVPSAAASIAPAARLSAAARSRPSSKTSAR
mmetsp:Transcript_56391/g.115373  ORF Transcript_56391/g.115373 Transcript_56391/m.115373 type:complete len:366 (-) Transcript_56391:281-1378(-)